MLILKKDDIFFEAVVRGIKKVMEAYPVFVL